MQPVADTIKPVEISLQRGEGLLEDEDITEGREANR